MKGLKLIRDLAETAATLEDASALSAKLVKNPKDLQARYDLALRYLAAADLDTAIDTLVELTRRDREWQEQKARKLLLELFDTMSPLHPLTGPGRRKLSSVLFS
jgi:putative thioredoxin